jgi:hypothetical protein
MPIKTPTELFVMLLTDVRQGAEKAEPISSGAIVRVDEDDRDAKENEVARDRQGWVAVYLHRRSLQPLPIAKPDGQSMTRSFDSALLNT